MQMSEQIADLAAALAEAQGEMENAAKNARNPHFKSSYADLAEIVNVSRPALAKHGLSLTQSPGFADGVATVTTLLLHKSGQWIMDTATAPVGKADAQGIGSVVTYLRRYSRAAFCGLAQEDDDGNAAVRHKAQQADVPIERITDRQVLELEALLSDTGSDKAKFLKFVGANRIEDIQAADFDDCKKVILRAAEAKAKQGQQA